MHLFENLLGAVPARVGGGGEACRGVEGGGKNLERSSDRLVQHAFDPPLVAAWACGLKEEQRMNQQDYLWGCARKT